VNTVYVRTGTSVYKCECEHSVCTYRYVRLQMWVRTQCMYVPVRPSTNVSGNTVYVRTGTSVYKKFSTKFGV